MNVLLVLDGNTGSASGGCFKIGSLSLIIYKGDITKETTDVIANSTDETLELSTGTWLYTAPLMIHISEYSFNRSGIFELVSTGSSILCIHHSIGPGV